MEILEISWERIVYMLLIEKTIYHWIKKHIDVLFFIVISVLALMIRISGLSFISDDMRFFLLHWFDQMRGGDFSKSIGDYGLLYQSLIYAMTHISFFPVYQYKILSFIFDFALAFVSAIFSCKLVGKEKFGMHFLRVYTFFLFLPTVFLNSSFWGQCDSIYTFFVICSLYFLYTDKIKMSFAVLGIAFAFKLQTIFIVPFYLYYYFHKQSFSIFNFLITVVVFWLSGFPGFIKGQNIWIPFVIYANQIHSYSEELYMNIHSFWTIFKNDPIYINAAIILTLSIFCFGMHTIIKYSFSLKSGENFLMVAVWTVWVCILFLPKMHERYTYLLDILLLLLSMKNNKFFVLFFISQTLSLLTYASNFGLFEGREMRYLSLVYLFSFIWFSFYIDKKMYQQEEFEKSTLKKSRKNGGVKK